MHSTTAINIRKCYPALIKDGSTNCLNIAMLSFSFTSTIDVPNTSLGL